jgi:alpha-N-arabinofuranosidase
MVFLGIRPVWGTHHLGRETFLAPVTWDEDGWPVVNGGRPIEPEMDADCLPPHPWPPEPVRDDFDEADLRHCWNFRRNPDPDLWSLTERPGHLRLHGSATTLDDVGAPAFVGRRQRHFDCRAETLLEFEPRRDGDEAGLTALMNERHHYEIALTRRGGERRIIVRRCIGDLQKVVADRPAGTGPLRLQIRAEPRTYAFGCARAGGPIETLVEGAARYLSTEVAAGFTGVYFAMYATGNGRPCGAPADFDWFEYEPSEE